MKKQNAAITRIPCQGTLTAADGSDITILYTLAISPNRKTYSIQISLDGAITMHIPSYMSRKRAEQILQEHSQWILSTLQLQKEKQKNRPTQALSEEELARKRARGTRIIRPLLATAIARYEPQLPAWHRPITRVTVREQKTRWGSCSSKGTLSFNWRLVNAPSEALEYVVVHELCHLCYMNHSAQFWNLVASIMPDYKIWRDWLRDHGNEL